MKMESFYLAFIVGTFYIQLSMGTLWDMMTDVRITKFRQLIIDAGLEGKFQGSACSSSDCPTAFLPNNTAFDIAYPAADLSQLTKVQKIEIVTQHYVYMTNAQGNPVIGTTGAYDDIYGLIVGEDIGRGRAKYFSHSVGGDFYWFKKGASFGINNAQMGTEVAATNGAGVYHIIDQVIPFGNDQPFLQYMLGESASLKLSYEMWDTLKKLPDAADRAYDKYLDFKVGNIDYYGSVFVPINAAWDDVGAELRTKIINDRTELRRVLGMHYVKNQMVFISKAIGQVTFKAGFPVPNDEARFNANVFSDAFGNYFVTAGGVTAKILKANIPIKRAVIHIIDRPLGLLYKNRVKILSDKAPRFLELCNTVRSCKTVLESSQNLTIFAPTDAAVARFLGMNMQEKEEYLKLHFTEGRLTKESMTNETLVAAVNETGFIRFKAYPKDTYVEGRLKQYGFVASRIMEFDLSGTDGIVHVIEQVLGYPTMFIKKFLEMNPQYRSFYGYIHGAQNDFKPELDKAGLYTVLAPTDTAFAEMLRDTVNKGKEIMDDVKSRYLVLRRSILPNLVLFEGKTPMKYEIATANFLINQEKILITVSVNEGVRSAVISYNGASIRIDLNDGGYRCINGLVYPIPKVLFVPGDLPKAATICLDGKCAARSLLAGPGALMLLLAGVVRAFVVTVV